MITTRAIAGLLFLLAACSACNFDWREETTQVDAKAQFTFLGNLDEIEVQLTKNGQPVWTTQDIQENTRYTLMPGTYQVRITRLGKLLVHRKIFLDDGKVAEIRVP